MIELKIIINTILSESSTINWLIVHKISKAISNLDDVEFSFVDGLERIDESFKTNQGYISIKKSIVVTQFENMISELTDDFNSNLTALANLYIITTRASYNGEDKEKLIKKFKTKIGNENCKRIFDILIESLNKQYYKHHHLQEISPKNTNDWLDLFHSTQYFHSISDPLLSTLRLVRSEKNRKLDFELIEKMKPLLRSILMGQYGFDLNISISTLKKLLKNEDELIFLSACLIDDSLPDNVSPDWLSQNLIDLFIEKYWGCIGKYMLVHIFGLSYRNKNENLLYKNLENLFHNNLIIQIKAEQTQTTEWINNLSFPNEYIALFSWFIIKKVEFQEIHDDNKVIILNQFIKELKRISEELPIHLASQNSSDPFNSFQLHETKYQDALAYLLLFILNSTSDNLSDIKNICFDFKPLFYGSYRANYLATHYTEVVLLIALSGYRIKGETKAMISNLKKYLSILAETILIPYVHISEREDEIWNSETENQIFEFNVGKHLINLALKNINANKIKINYQDFFSCFESIKIAQWPYERNII